MAPCAWASCRRVSGASSPGRRSERSSDCMDLADRTVMLLGGSGQANVRALAGSKAPVLAEAAWRLLATDDALRQQIISVGLPIVAPDGKTVYRGSSVVVPPEAGRLLEGERLVPGNAGRPVPLPPDVLTGLYTRTRLDDHWPLRLVQVARG